MKKRYVFHEDPGHGWLEVDRTELASLVDLSLVSSFSYQKEHKVFLEEDCDASLFIQAAKKAGIEVEFEERVSNDLSPIRNYQRFVFEH